MGPEIAWEVDKQNYCKVPREHPDVLVRPRVREADVGQLDRGEAQVRQAIDAVLSIRNEYKHDDLKNEEELGLHLVVLEDEHAFLDLVRLEGQQRVDVLLAFSGSRCRTASHHIGILRSVHLVVVGAQCENDLALAFVLHVQILYDRSIWSSWDLLTRARILVLPLVVDVAVS